MINNNINNNNNNNNNINNNNNNNINKNNNNNNNNNNSRKLLTLIIFVIIIVIVHLFTVDKKRFHKLDGSFTFIRKTIHATFSVSVQYSVVWILWLELRIYLQRVWFSDKFENITHEFR